MTYKRFIIAESKGTQWIEEMTLNGKPITNITQAVNKLNELDTEIQQLKKENKLLEIEDENWTKLSEEDENTINRLNTRMEKINKLIDEKIKEYQFKPQLACYIPTTCKHKHSCLHNHEINVSNGSKLQLLKKLKEELYQE